jgi:hypothetical protein
MLRVSIREYRELVEGEAWPSYAVRERIEEFSGWPRTFGGVSNDVEDDDGLPL